MVPAQIAPEPGRAGGIILNRTATKSSALQLALGALSTFGLPVCRTAIVQRVAHPYSSASGMTAQEYEPGGLAAKEIAQVWKWAKDLMNG
jgi:chromosome partitioning protein